MRKTPPPRRHARRRKKRDDDDDDDDDELIADDDVEADLDKILKDRMVTVDEDDDEDDEDDETDVRGEGAERLQPKQQDEQLCPSCFLLVRASAPNCPVGDDDCPDLLLRSVGSADDPRSARRLVEHGQRKVVLARFVGKVAVDRRSASCATVSCPSRGAPCRSSRRSPVDGRGSGTVVAHRRRITLAGGRRSWRCTGAGRTRAARLRPPAGGARRGEVGLADAEGTCRDRAVRTRPSSPSHDPRQARPTAQDMMGRFVTSA